MVLNKHVLGDVLKIVKQEKQFVWEVDLAV